MSDARWLAERVTEAVHDAVVGYDDLVELLTVALLARGHVILAGMPGVAKTTVATAFARSLGLEFRHVQLTPDSQPSDLVGPSNSIGDGDLESGPIFTNVLLVDELNRAPPRTQSTLVRTLDERQVTIRGEPLDLPRPFMTIATLDPTESDGSYGLSPRYRDRFMFRLEMAPLDLDDGLELLNRYEQDGIVGPGTIESVSDATTVCSLQEEVAAIYANDEIKRYLLEVVMAVREHPDVRFGASSRAALLFLSACEARAAIKGRDYVIPDDVKALAVPLLEPRLVLTTEAELNEIGSGAVVREALDSVLPPGPAFADDDSDRAAKERSEFD